MSKPRNNLRLFVGVYPPTGTARAMLAALEDLDLPAHRRTPIEQLHMTLQFIGDTPVKELDATIESVDRSRAGLAAFELAPLRLMTLPQRGRSRLVAAETDAPSTLLELQRRLATRLAQNVRSRPGDRFLPHLTLCRFRAPTRIEPLDEPLALDAFPVRELKLMRSTLHPDGAKHHEVAAFSLEDPRG
ncbi:MAG: RNA 2',3'-cyclic phosphodiesterase [Planctomycetota bacterium]|nr:RNA 2',3'-cyclic phosphodiesterase [Planctomycetota bacterium]